MKAVIMNDIQQLVIGWIEYKKNRKEKQNKIKGNTKSLCFAPYVMHLYGV